MAVLLWLKLAFLLWNVLDLNLVLVTAYLFTLNHLAVVGDAYLKIVHFNIPGNCPNLITFEEICVYIGVHEAYVFKSMTVILGAFT